MASFSFVSVYVPSHNCSPLLNLLFPSFLLSFFHPQVLCPLNNVTMLDYTIEWLASSGVEELFVFCVHHADQVEAYVEASSWTSVIKVICVKEKTITNAGDALRELDKMGLVRSDPFIMVYGDVVTNVDIRGALKEHKKRHKADDAAIMTILFKQVDHMSAVRQISDDLVVGLNSATNQITLFHNDITDPCTEIPTSFFDAHSQIDVRTDLLDCGIDICKCLRAFLRFCVFAFLRFFFVTLSRSSWER